MLAPCEQQGKKKSRFAPCASCFRLDDISDGKAIKKNLLRFALCAGLLSTELLLLVPMFANVCFLFLFFFFFLCAAPFDGCILLSKMRQKLFFALRAWWLRDLLYSTNANCEQWRTRETKNTRFAHCACVFCSIRLKRNDARIKNVFALHGLAYIVGPWRLTLHSITHYLFICFRSILDREVVFMHAFVYSYVQPPG